MKNMLKIALALALAAALAGCETPKRPSVTSTAPVIEIGQPQIVIAPGGYVLVDQAPLLLAGKTSVTWRLPADGGNYSNFSVTIDHEKKRVETDGRTVRYFPINPVPVNLEIKCGPIEAGSVSCALPVDRLKKNTVYSYTIRFVRNGLQYELDPDMML